MIHRIGFWVGRFFFTVRGSSISCNEQIEGGEWNTKTSLKEVFEEK